MAHYAGEDESEYTSTECDDLMKDIVTNSIADGTNPAPDAGTRVWSGLSVAGDLTDGPQLDKGCSWKQLLTASGGGVLADLAEAAAVAGTEVFFDVVADVATSGSITFEFRTYTGQPGMDVSDKVTFSQENRNLKDPFIEYDYSDEITYVYAGGQGEEDEREIQQVYDAARYNISAWNRCEGFADARDQETANGVREVGRAKLNAGAPKIRAGGIPVDTEGTRFGLHWNFGYKVAMKYRRREFDCIVRSVVLSVDRSGEESINARLEYES